MRASEVTLDWLKENLDGWEGSGNQFYAWCPVHDDIGSSMKGLSITVVGKRILCKCHSDHCGATLPAVIKAILDGEHTNGHEPVVTVRKSKGSNGLKAWAEYTQVEESIWRQLGTEEDGDSVVFVFEDSEVRKYRSPGKQIHFEPKGKGISPLWPIPGENLPEHISITEGESDCGTTYAAGLPPGYSVTKGSNTPLSAETFHALARQGVREITFYGDADEAGASLRQRIISLAIEANLTCNVCDLTRVSQPWWPIKDINELWKETSLDEFHELIERATYEVAKTRPAMTMTDIGEEADKDIDWVIDHLLAPSDKAMIWAPPKTYKTWITLDLVRALVTGQPFLQRDEWAPKKQHRVFLVEEEGNLQLFARRVARLHLDEDAPFYLWHREAFAFNNEDAVANLISSCRELEIDVLIFDPLQRMIPGVNENDAAETGIVWDVVARIQQAIPGIVVLIVHHTSKADANGWATQRGSSRHAGEVDFGLSLEQHDEDNAVLIWIDGRDMPHTLAPGEKLKCQIEITDDSFTANAKDVEVKVKAVRRGGGENTDFVLNAIRGGCETRTEIMRECNLTDNTVIRHIKSLLEQHLIIEEDNGVGKPKTYKEAQ